MQFNSIAQIQWVQCVDALGMHVMYYTFPVNLVYSGIVTLMPFWCIAWPAELTCSPPECFTIIAYPLFQAYCSGIFTAHAWMTDTRFSWGFLDRNVKASCMHSRDSGVITHNPFPPCGLWLFLPFISPLMGLDCSLISSVHSSYTRCSLLLITIMATHPFFFFSAVIGLYYIIIFHCLNPPVLLEYSEPI